MTSFTLPTWLLLVLVQLLIPVRCQSGENFSQVLKDTLTLDPRVRPVKNFTTTTVVNVSFHLMSIINFDTVKQRLESNGWLYVQWINEYVTWNPTDYGGVQVVSPDPDMVWRPRLTVLNTMKDMKPIGEDYITIMSAYDGSTVWYPAERFETFCRVDVTYFPFDIQTCDWKMFIWGGDPIEAIDIHPLISTIDLQTFVVNGEWELLATRAWEEVGKQGGTDTAYVLYEVRLRRRPSLLVLTVLLPVLVLALVNVFVFTIPSEAGERLAYSMTALLSFGVFMSFILDSMPSSTETLSIVAVNMSFLLVLSAVYVLLCILSLRLFHRDPVKHPVPSTVQSLIVWLEVLVCLDPPAKNKIDVIRIEVIEKLASSGVAGGHTDAGATNSGLKGKLDKWKMTKEMKRAAYSDPEEMTWRRVSRTLDKLLFRFFFCLVLVSNGSVWGVMADNYFNGA